MEGCFFPRRTCRITFFGYYLSLATTVKEDGRPEAAELVRRMSLVSCDHDPVPAMVEVLAKMPKTGTPLGC